MALMGIVLEILSRNTGGSTVGSRIPVPMQRSSALFVKFPAGNIYIYILGAFGSEAIERVYGVSFDALWLT